MAAFHMFEAENFGGMIACFFGEMYLIVAVCQST